MCPGSAFYHKADTVYETDLHFHIIGKLNRCRFFRHKLRFRRHDRSPGSRLGKLILCPLSSHVRPSYSGSTSRSINLLINVDLPVRTGPTTPMYISPFVRAFHIPVYLKRVHKKYPPYPADTMYAQKYGGMTFCLLFPRKRMVLAPGLSHHQVVYCLRRRFAVKEHCIDLIYDRH